MSTILTAWLCKNPPCNNNVYMHSLLELQDITFTPFGGALKSLFMLDLCNNGKSCIQSQSYFTSDQMYKQQILC